jgi:hypothetical protein
MARCLFEAEPHRRRSMKPDFSGEYVLNRQACTLSPGAAAVQSGVVRIEHREPMFQYQATFIADGKTLEYTFERRSDGREVAASDGVSSLHWEENVLVAMDRTEDPVSGVTMSWRYELVDGGRRLRAIEQIRGAGRDQDSVWVFDRRHSNGSERPRDPSPEPSPRTRPSMIRRTISAGQPSPRLMPWSPSASDSAQHSPALRRALSIDTIAKSLKQPRWEPGSRKRRRNG